MRLSHYSKTQWQVIAVMGLMLMAACGFAGWWWSALVIVLCTLGVLSFFRDPERKVPSGRGMMVSPADGTISSVHKVEHFEPFQGPAMCIRVFLSVFNVHINRSPCHGKVKTVTIQKGDHLSALNPRSALVNASSLMLIVHTQHDKPIAAVRQVAGQFARTIINTAKPDQILQRGQRYGMITLGSTTELYIPQDLAEQIAVKPGQKVRAGQTIVAKVTMLSNMLGT